MYVNPNFRTKKSLKEAVADDKVVTVFQPGLGSVPANGMVCCEGPHAPKPHKWYAECTLRDGQVIKVK